MRAEKSRKRIFGWSETPVAKTPMEWSFEESKRNKMKESELPNNPRQSGYFLHKVALSLHRFGLFLHGTALFLHEIA